MSYNNVFFIYGPTAVGKTDFVYQLALHLPIAIINMDVGQFYTPLSIGTAKPDWQSSSIEHYFFDLLNDPVNFTAIEYRNKASELVSHLHKNGKVPVFVGGSGFYLKSLLFPTQAMRGTLPIISSHNYSWKLLHAIDPERAHAIDPHDTYRIQRALSIWYTTGLRPSQCKPLYQPLFPRYTLICLERTRENLYTRINERVIAMFAAGWVDEVKKLKNTAWEDFICRKGFIGYREVFNFLNGVDGYTQAEIIKKIQQATRRYAKRQMTFWRMIQKNCLIADPALPILSFNLTLHPIDLYINQLAQNCYS